MRPSRFLAVFLIAAFLTTASGAQDIVEGDLPPGNPFDGTSDRASMFDLYQVANITLAASAAGGSEMASPALTTLESTLSARGYPGTRIVVLSETETLDHSCSKDGTVEIRVWRKAQHDAVTVVVASENWFSKGKPGLETSGIGENFAQACERASR